MFIVLVTFPKWTETLRRTENRNLNKSHTLLSMFLVDIRRYNWHSWCVCCYYSSCIMQIRQEHWTADDDSLDMHPRRLSNMNCNKMIGAVQDSMR